MPKLSAAFADLVSNNKSDIVAELGIYKGKLMRTTMKNCGEQIKEYFAFDTWKRPVGKIFRHMASRTQEEWDKLHWYACEAMLLYKQIKVFRMDILEAATLFPNEYFDIVLIDTSHLYENTLMEIKAWLPLVKKGGILCGDDYGCGRRKGHRVKEAVDEYFGNDITIDRILWIHKKN